MNSPHPIDLIEAEVAQVYKRSMRHAADLGRTLNAAEEVNLAALSIAVSVRRIADAARLLVLVVVLAVALMMLVSWFS